MPAQDTQKRIAIHRITLKGFVAPLLFVFVAILIEYLIVLYALGLGVEEKPENLLNLSFQLPSTDWSVALYISPLFHLVPITVVIALVCTWTYLTKKAVTRTPKSQRWNVRTAARNRKELESKGSGSLLIKAKSSLSKATTRSAWTMILIFLTLILAVSLLTYPRLIYWIVSDAYESNPSLLSFVKSVGQALVSIGEAFSAINSALLAAAPGFRDFVVAIGSLARPLAELDNAGKYLVFQNAAAWISSLLVVFHGEYGWKAFGHSKKRT